MTFTFKTGTRRYVPGSAGGPLHVPLWTAEEAGDVIEGFIDVPMSYVGLPQHTNARHVFDQNLARLITDWVEWRAKDGWKLSTRSGWASCDHCAKRFSNLRPHVCGPYDVPFSTVRNDSDEEHKRYWVTARFMRETPLYAPLNDILAFQDEFAMYGIDPNAPAPVSTRIKQVESDVHRPLEWAERRRQALGLKRKDLLLSPLRKPL